ncbi:MAG: methylmalonyl Co-A mutase-associated GTPase MeaB [Acidimicrobiales bacterium]|nr:methylmalonyl Co-A mutase-associated GTPase MeaB [Acidimicrobiales bacterium]
MTNLPGLVANLRAGDRRALAKAITLVESRNPAHLTDKAHLLDLLIGGHRPADTTRLGISGTPGVGKSTLIEAFGRRLISQGRRVAVLAVDPSSALSGGSILGDKTRMPELAISPDAYVRPSPAGGGLGGITSATAATITCCEAGGFDYIIVETVGIGQSETAVAGVTDLFLLLHSPGGGDELQGIKRGVMELADRVAVTKADGELLPAAKRAQAELRSALHLLRPKPGREPTEVDLVSARTGDGVDNLLLALTHQHTGLSRSGALKELRETQVRQQFEEAMTDGIRARAFRIGSPALRNKLQIEVEAGRKAPMAGAIEWLAHEPIQPTDRATEINAITLGVAEMTRSIAFYQALGLELQFRANDNGFATFRHGRNFINLEKNERPGSNWGRVVLFVPDPDAIHKLVVGAGFTAETEPQDAPWGERYFHVRDPDGHELSFARKL